MSAFPTKDNPTGIFSMLPIAFPTPSKINIEKDPMYLKDKEKRLQSFLDGLSKQYAPTPDGTSAPEATSAPETTTKFWRYEDGLPAAATTDGTAAQEVNPTLADIPTSAEDTSAADDKKAIGNMAYDYQSGLSRLAALFPKSDDTKLQEMIDQNVGAQKSYLSNIEKQLKASLHSKDNLDLSPLIGLTDTWTGSNLFKYYQKPNKKEQIAEMQSNLVKGQGNLIDSLRGFERDKINRATAREQMLANLEGKRMALEAAKREHSVKEDERDIARQINGDKFYRQTYKPLLDEVPSFYDGIDSLQSLLSKSNKTEIASNTKEYAAFKSDLSRLLLFINNHEAKLGALAGADLDLLRSVAGDNWTAAINTEGMIRSLAKLKNVVANKIYNFGKLQEKSQNNKGSAVYGSKDAWENNKERVWKKTLMSATDEILSKEDLEQLNNELK